MVSDGLQRQQIYSIFPYKNPLPCQKRSSWSYEITEQRPCYSEETRPFQRPSAVTRGACHNLARWQLPRGSISEAPLFL